MILGDLFESRMSELDIEYQDYKNLEPVAFYSRYKMSKDDWASKHWSLIKSSETVHEGVAEAEGDPEGLPHLTKELLTHIVQQVGTEGAHAIVKSLKWGDGAAKELLQLIVKDLKNNISMAESVKQRLDPKCWKGKHKEGTKIKGGVRVNNCVPNESQDLEEKWTQKYKSSINCSNPKGFSQKAHCAGKKKDVEESTAKERWIQAADARQKKHDEIERKRQEAAKQGKTDVAGAIGRLEKALGEEGSHRFKGPHGVVDVDQSKPGVTKVTRHSDVGAKSFSNRDQGKGPGTGVKGGSGVSATQGTSRTFPRLNIDGPELNEENAKLTVGDPVIVTAPNQFEGKTGEIAEFSPSGKFVIVNLYNYGEHAMHLSDIEYNQYADDQDELDEDWQKVNKKDKTAGMSSKAVKAYRRENPGSKLQTAVTTKPSKLKKGSKASKRRKSFCARSNGQKKMHNIDCSKTPDKAICAARRRWNCEEDIAEALLAELQFLGSECTKDCSGHRAGYNWSKRQGGVDGMSPWSPSFNKGAALAKAGK